MKACETCRVNVMNNCSFCPLCGAELSPALKAGNTPPQSNYPDLSDALVKYSFYMRLAVFISLLGCGISVLINFLASPSTFWSLLVIGATVYSWATIPPLLRRGVNFARQTVLMVTLTSLLMIGIDIYSGYRGWSLTYAVPGLLASGTLAIAIMIVFNRTNWAQYVLYQVLMGVFGFVPLVLYFAGLSQNLIMVLITSGLSLASILATVVFADRSIKSEFKRRFHV